MVRDGERWREASWDAAFDLVAENIRATRARFGKDAVAVYQKLNAQPGLADLRLLLRTSWHEEPGNGDVEDEAYMPRC